MPKSPEQLRPIDTQLDGKGPELTPESSPQDAWMELMSHHGPDWYQATIENHAKTLSDGGVMNDHARNLVANSVDYFQKKVLVETKGRFFDKADKLERAYKKAIKNIEKETQSELDKLKKSIGKAEELTDFSKKAPEAERKAALRRHFGKYLEALNGQYFDKGADKNRDAAYKRASGNLKHKLAVWVDGNLDAMVDSKASPAQIEAFKKKVAARYRKFASFDGNDAFISGEDLNRIDFLAHKPMHINEEFWRTSEEDFNKRLEVIAVMEPRKFRKYVEIIASNVIIRAKADRTQAEFIAQVKTSVPGAKDVKNFKQAEKAYIKHMDVLARQGAFEVTEFNSQFAGSTFEETLHYERRVKPESMEQHVDAALRLITSGAVIPEKAEDRLLARFIRTNEKGRKSILMKRSSRMTLLRAIRISKERYPDIYRDMTKSFPAQASAEKPLPHSTEVARPNRYDRAARLQAMIILGNQADAIVKRYDDVMPADLDKSRQKVDMPSKESLVRTGLKFSVPSDQKAVFESGLSQGGFNTRDMALAGAKMLGMLAMVANVAQSFNDAGDMNPTDFMDRLAKTVELTATNQGFLAGAGITTVTHLAQYNPQYLKWPWLSQYGRDGLEAGRKLDRMRMRVGAKNLDRFLASQGEWQALQKLKPDDIKDLVSEGSKVKPKGISIAMLEKAGAFKGEDGEQLKHAMDGTKIGTRTRLEMYKRFFGGSKQKDVNYVKELCTGDSFIT